MVYHPRGYTEEALGCVQNVVERVNRREALDPSSANPYLMEIGHYYQSVLHCLPLLEGAIVDEDVSHAAISKPTVPYLPPEQTPEPGLTSLLSSPQNLSPAVTLPFEGFILEGRKRHWCTRA
ncbi:hypothetical protein H6P81_002699 [Aristolochia fimbriata]|uniref:Uncharacterized protein n=1 Tax=Aristolochia fimbriata TaxID=158543 RepID=A0AAV7FEC7_ARIFI|nr:hypothetical protein H6P81_002699 [Aristolochia fimbriata]